MDVKDSERTREELLGEIEELRGRVAELEAITKDLTRADKVMRMAVVSATEEQARTQAIIAALGDGISMQDRNFRVLFQNEVHKNMVGDHTGEFCYKAYRGRDKVCEGCHLVMSFRDGGVHKKEQSKTTGEETRYFEIASSPLRDQDGNIVAGIEAVREITDRKLAELDRERLISELQEALEKIKTLRGLLPICAWCKKIRDDSGYWKKVEDYLEEHTDALFTHGICPECYKKVNPGEVRKPGEDGK
jgi:signal transduction histidine kinase